MATVYRAYDQRLGVQRAIKVMLPSFAEKPRVRARFEAEARTMAVLDHPSIVRVYDVGSNDETAWIVMELVEGGSLLQKIGSSGISVEDCLRYTARVLEALEVAHRHEVVHRDIKPHNVLLTLDGEARITDFGIARSAGHSSESFTKTGTVMGTWARPSASVRTSGTNSARARRSTRARMAGCPPELAPSAPCPAAGPVQPALPGLADARKACAPAACRQRWAPFRHAQSPCAAAAVLLRKVSSPSLAA